MSDAPESFIQRFLFEALDIRGAIVRLDSAWTQMLARRDYSPRVAAMLGEMCAVTVLVGSNLKQAGRVTVQLQGDGPVSLLMVECTDTLNVRGMARAAQDADGDLPTLLGDGRLALTVQPDGATQPYQSIVPVTGENVAEVFEHYLSQSVQHAAHLFLHADANHAVGLLVEKLPQADLRDADGWARVMQLAATVSAQELATRPVAQLLTQVFPEEDIRLYDARAVRFHCPEDWDKVRNMLRSLGREEVEAMLREQGEVVIHDEICNHEYRFDSEDIAALFPPSPPPTLH